MPLISMFAAFPERSGWYRNRLCTAFDVAADPQEVTIDFKESRGLICLPSKRSTN
jgi:hypothetical protein